MATRDIKSESFEKGNYQALTAGMFLSEMLSFQVGAFRIAEAFLPLEGNSNFFRQFDFGVKSCFINNAEESFEKGKGKITPLALDGGFEGAGPFEKSHYIDTSDIYRL